MNKNIVFGLLAVVLLGGAYFAYDSMNKDSESNNATEQIQNSQQETNSQTQAPTSTAKSGQTTSLTQLSKEGAQVCDLTIQPSSIPNSYTGKFYTNGSNEFRYEIQSGTQGETYYLIVANKTFYNWSSKSNQGIKRQVEATTDAEYDAAINESDLSQVYNFNCSPWQVEASVLTPPASITFMDIASMQGNPFQ